MLLGAIGTKYSLGLFPLLLGSFGANPLDLGEKAGRPAQDLFG